jgi:hypothetical protein
VEAYLDGVGDEAVRLLFHGNFTEFSGIKVDFTETF